jgi:hypothetical protein
MMHGKHDLLLVGFSPLAVKLKNLVVRIAKFGIEDFFHPTDDAACQANFNSMGMGGRLCENILNDSFRQLAGALVLFLDNLDESSRFNISLNSSIHKKRTRA